MINHSNTDNKPTIRFSIPEFYGVTMHIGGDIFEMFDSAEKRLTDEFLDMLLETGDKKEFSFCLYDSVERQTKTTYCFKNNILFITLATGITKQYDISLIKFRETFFQHVHDYALYYAAPYNYQAFFLKPYEEMTNTFSRYQEKANKIREKIEIK